MSRPVSIFHTSVAPFVQQAALALQEANLLERFYTTVRYDDTSRVQRAICQTVRLVGVDLKSQLKRRTVTGVLPEKITSFPLGELIRLASGRFDKSGRLTDLAWERSEKQFAAKVARRIHAGLSAVYGYEFGSLAVFERARRLGVKTVYDVPAPEPSFVENLLKGEMARFPELKTNYAAHVAQREDRRTAHRRAEWELADVVIAASQFTRSSFETAGRDVSKIRIVPYGAPPVAPRDEVLSLTRAAGPTRLVWAGTFSVRKGAHYLLDAWRGGRLGKAATLDVFGSVTLPDRLLSPTPEGIRFHGPVSRDELLAAFRSADALIFPTLCDGFGMVVTEAWSQGLPVITTDRAGAVDLLKPGENGVLVPAGNAEALEQALLKLADESNLLGTMRESALATAASWQWSDYRRALIRALLPDLEGT